MEMPCINLERFIIQALFAPITSFGEILLINYTEFWIIKLEDFVLESKFIGVYIKIILPSNKSGGGRVGGKYQICKNLMTLLINLLISSLHNAKKEDEC